MRENFDEFDDLKDYIDTKLSDIYVSEKLKAKTLGQFKTRKRHSHQWVFAPAAAVVSLVILFNSPVKVNITDKLSSEQAGISREQVDYALNTDAEVKDDTTEELIQANSSNGESVKSEKDTQNQIVSSTKGNNENQSTKASSHASSTAKQKSLSNSSLVAQAGSDKKNNSTASVQGVTNTEKNDNNAPGSANTPASGIQSPVAAVMPSLDNDTKALSPKVKNQIDIQIEKASDFLQNPLLLPKSMPEGFQLVDISIPSSKTEGSDGVKISYTLKNQYITLYESAKSGIVDQEGSKEIMINKYKAFVSTIESTSEDAVHQVETELQWEDSNLHYKLEGNINEDQLIEIAKSLD